MHYFRRKGWEIPASSATPEALFVDRRAVLAGLGASGALAGLAGRARAEDADPSASLYPAKRNEAFTLDREMTPEKIQPQPQQLLRVQHEQAHRRQRVENAPVDGQARWRGRERADRRHRHVDQNNWARRAALPTPLRRSLVDGDSLDRLPAARLVDFARRCPRPSTCSSRPSSTRKRRPASGPSCPGPTSRA